MKGLVLDRRRSFVLIAMLAALLLAVSACGSTPAPVSTATETISPTTIPGVTSPPEATPTQDAAMAQVMQLLIGRTRHFKGAANAPVTILEFSDFQ